MLTVLCSSEYAVDRGQNDDEDDTPRESHQSPQERGYSLLDPQNAISEVHGDETLPE
jgi:hypothetical protein